MKEMESCNMVELSKEEMCQLNGGFIPVVGLLLAACAFAYNIGKDAAERDRRLQQSK